MRNYLKGLQKMSQDMQDTIDQRWETFNDRSDRWQESEAADIYADKTDKLEEIISSVDDLVSDIEAYLED